MSLLALRESLRQLRESLLSAQQDVNELKFAFFYATAVCALAAVGTLVTLARRR